MKEIFLKMNETTKLYESFFCLVNNEAKSDERSLAHKSGFKCHTVHTVAITVLQMEQN